MLRLFVAIDLPDVWKPEVAAVCTDVHGARWVKPAQLHITLRFLGDTPEEKLPAIRERLASVQAPPFPMGLHGVGVFPDPPRRPRVIWLGLAPAEPLIALKCAIDHALDNAAPSSVKAEPEFSPHLTLARLSTHPGGDLTRFLAQHRDFRSADFRVDCFQLYRSTLHPSGAVHERVSAYPLAAFCRVD
jgi:RNA 2',3'-cyclic 3'-phosphodiesterase